MALALHAGLDVVAVHVHHGNRSSADRDAATARSVADRLDSAFRCEYADVADGPNFEARARAARHDILGPDAMTGHTADDQVETVLLALLRGSGATGLSGMPRGHRHPLLALRRRETHEVCRTLGIEPAVDPTNADPRHRRNRVRHEVVTLLDDVADRDVTPLIVRAADLLLDDDRFLDELASTLDATMRARSHPRRARSPVALCGDG